MSHATESCCSESIQSVHPTAGSSIKRIGAALSGAVLRLMLCAGLQLAVPSMTAAQASDPGVVSDSAPVTQTESSMASPMAVTGATYYVSRNGNNADGRSWATAWSAPDKINWSVMRPGDIVELDGGAGGMTYSSSQIAPTVNGAAGAPITIRVSTQTGHNGPVTLFGGRSTLLPYCGQTSYTFQTSGVQAIGINLNGRAYITVDGGKWHGLHVYGYNKFGVELQGSNHIILRNLEINDNGTASNSTGSWEPDQEGIHLAGDNNLVERADIYDNGQDSLQSSGDFSNFTLAWSYLHATRTDPSGNLWNACRHVDGIQVWSGSPSGLTVHDSIISGGMQGLLLGDTNGLVNNVYVYNTLLFGASNANIHTNDTVHAFNGWRIDHVTSVRGVGAGWVNIRFRSSTNDLKITNSIFYGGSMMDVPASGTYSNNCQYQVPQGVSVGQNVDPKFTSMASGDYALLSGSPCAGKGSSITSVAQFLQLVGSSEPLPRPLIRKVFVPYVER